MFCSFRRRQLKLLSFISFLKGTAALRLPGFKPVAAKYLYAAFKKGGKVTKVTIFVIITFSIITKQHTVETLH